MGYDLTAYGTAVAVLEVQSGYSVVETASHIALTTMALDIKSAEQDFERSRLPKPDYSSRKSLSASYHVLRIGSVSSHKVSMISSCGKS
jgi:hypothetical protein